jgi:hypothetical protein
MNLLVPTIVGVVMGLIVAIGSKLLLGPEAVVIGGALVCGSLSSVIVARAMK